MMLALRGRLPLARVLAARPPPCAIAVRGLAKKKKKEKKGKAPKPAKQAARSSSAPPGDFLDIFAPEFDAPLLEGLASTTDALASTLGRMRGGAASVELLEALTVPCYGGKEAMASVAHVAVRSTTLIEVGCFDPSVTAAVAEAIRGIDGLSLNPTETGPGQLAVPIPRPSAEQRDALAKAAAAAAEAAKERARRHRKDAHDRLKQAVVDVSEDDVRAKKGEIDAAVESATTKITALLDAKKADLEAEI